MILPFFIGTYTSATGSQGIYQSTLNLETGQLSPPKLAAETANPSYLALHPTLPILACVNEIPKGSVTIFEFSPQGQPTQLSQTPVAGNGPCHLSFNPAGTKLFSASYGDGTFSFFDFKDKIPQSLALVRSNPADADNAAPHAHCIKAHPTLNLTYATDLGRNQIIKFDNQLTATIYPMRAGTPRHFVFHPSGNTMYVNSERSSSVSAFKIHSKLGELNEVQNLSTIDPKNKTGNTTAEIIVHPSGKFLYVSNRGHNTVATFKILDNESLSQPLITPIGTHSPRGMAVDPTGQFMLVAGQMNNLIECFQLDQLTGVPSKTSGNIQVDKPVHLLFLNR